MELDEKNLGILLRNVENDMLVVALKGADEKLRDKMLGCMSARAADIDPRRDGRARPDAPRRGAGGAEGGARHRPPPRRRRHDLMLAGRGDDYV